MTSAKRFAQFLREHIDKLRATARLAKLSEDNELLERRLSGLHDGHSKTIDSANAHFHRANRYGSALQWIAEHGDGEARRRARAALAQGQKEGE